MSKYTTEVRFICETAYGLEESKGANSVDEILDKVVDKIFNFDFPIFDENYRKVLEIKILKHFYTREIGFETVGLWKLKLNTKLNEIMPLYNQYYKSELLEFNPLYNANYTKTGRGKNEGTNEQTGNDRNTRNGKVKTTSESMSRYSDTPQGSISDLKANTYLTNATIDDMSSGSESGETSEADRTNSGEYRDLREYADSVQGMIGSSGSKLLEDFRKTFMNIDMLVISDLESLFMQLW